MKPILNISSRKAITAAMLLMLPLAPAIATIQWIPSTSAQRDLLVSRDTTDTEKPATTQENEDNKNDKKKDKADKKKEESAYDKLIKQGGSYTQGMLSIRHIKDDWYMEVPDSMLGRLLLTVTRFTSVPQGFKMLPGEEIERNTIYFEKYNESTLFLRQFVQDTYANEDQAISRSLAQANINPIVAKLEVIGDDKKKAKDSHLVNVTKLLMGDNPIFGLDNGDRSAVMLGSQTNDRSFIDTVKTYPTNMEVQSIRTFTTTKGGSEASKTGQITLSLNTSVVMLPKMPMRPRYWDERVGYFTDKRVEYSDDKSPKHEQIISRYKLVPKNIKKYLKGELTEPVNPIVYYIDPNTPKKWIPYLIAGIEDWNQAFEAAGFKNAIQAKEWPNDKDMSVDDARYCVLRYLPSETENAYGPRIADPRSGEIIESHVCWYHNVIALLKKWYMTQCGPLDKRAQTMNMDDKLMGQLIRFVSSHEVGHTLGLRHNMGSSFATPVEKLRDKAWVEAHGHTVSIMDYARFNYVAQPEDGISEKGLFPRIGDYDKWAIKWGYQYRPEFKNAKEEKDALRAEVTKKLTADLRLWFGGEGTNSDPRAQTEDLSDDNIKAASYGIKNMKRIMTNLEKWTYQPDGVTDDLSEIHHELRSRLRLFLGHVQLHIIGKLDNSNIPNRPVKEYESKARQKEAIQWIDDNIFTAPMWLYPEEICNKLGTDYKEEISDRQTGALTVMLTPNQIDNINDESMSNMKNPYTVQEYLGDVFKAVWKPLTDKNDIQNDLRRSMQRTYIDLLGKILVPTDSQQRFGNNIINRSDVVPYVAQHLDQVESYVKTQLTAANSINKYHYQDLLRRINVIKKTFNGDK